MKCRLKNRTNIIDDYFEEKLPEQKKESFEEHMFNCDECFTELRIKEEMIGIIQKEGHLLFADYIKNKNSSILQKITGRLNSLFIRPVYSWTAAAAVCLILFLIVGRPFERSPSSLSGLAEISPYPYLDLGFRNGEVSAQFFTYGMHAYKRKDYAAACERLTRAVTRDPGHLNARFYLGVCCLLANKISDAQDHLTRVVSLEPDAERGYWYLAQVYLLQENKQKTIQMLEHVVQLNQHQYKERAEKLIKKVGEFSEH